MGIRARLLLSFSGLIFIFGLTGVAGWYSTAKLSAEMLEISSDNVMGAVELAKAETALWQLRYGFPQYLALGPVDGAYIPAEQSKWFAQIDGAIAAYSSGKRTPEEREALKHWSDISSRYFAARPRWFELVKEGRLIEAASLRANQTTPLGSEAVKALNRLIELQQVTARERIAYATNAAARARSVLVALVLAAVALSLALGTFNTRAITAAVTAMVRHFNELGDGRWDLSRRVAPPPIRELAEMASRFNRLIEEMARVIAEVNADASAVSAAAAHVLSAARAVSQGANLQWTTAREVTLRLLDIDESIGQTA
jgi:methyl-accepting chemotaxis protein